MTESVVQRSARKIAEGEKRNSYDSWIREPAECTYTTIADGNALEVERTVEVRDDEVDVTIVATQFGQRAVEKFSVKKPRPS